MFQGCDPQKEAGKSMPPRIGDKQGQLLVPEFGAEQHKVDCFGPQTFQSAEKVR